MAKTSSLRRLAVSLAAALIVCTVAAAAAPAQSGDPRIDASRAALDALDHHAQRPACACARG